MTYGTGSTIPFPNASVMGFWMFSVDEGRGRGRGLTGTSERPVPVPIGDNLTAAETGTLWLVTPLAAGLLFFRGRRRKS